MSNLRYEAIYEAAQCWQDEETSTIEFDSRLATAFANRLNKKLELIEAYRVALGDIRNRTNDASIEEQANAVLMLEGLYD